ncbi:hypothetical protein Btru_057894 [Bulinus truncatus]|nr:hypothetical protein Btru_057894 [Bulinus truncatus]
MSVLTKTHMSGNESSSTSSPTTSSGPYLASDEWLCTLWLFTTVRLLSVMGGWSSAATGMTIRATEAKEFYWGLFSSAQKYGTRLECAVLEALYGNALSSSSVPDHPPLGWAYHQENAVLGQTGNTYVSDMMPFPRPHFTTGQSEISDNVFMSRTDSNNQTSLSSSNAYFSGSPHEAAFSSPAFQASSPTTISCDGIHSTWLTNGNFGTFINDFPLPPCLQCPIVMLKSPAESAARANSVSNTPAASIPNAFERKSALLKHTSV